MMQTRAIAGALALGLTFGLTASGAEGMAGGKRACSSINLGGPKIFFKHNMNCKAAKKKARQVYASRGENEPRKFNCQSGSNFEDGGSCQHVSKDKYFGWHPADKRTAAKRERCGKYNSTSDFAKARVTAIRGVECEEALKVARKFDHRGDAKPPWECFLAHGSGRALFSCGYGGTSGDVRDFPHALVARGVGPRGG
jgi:hypothetical protein